MMKGFMLTAAFLLAVLRCEAKVDIVHKDNLSDKRAGMHREKFIAAFDKCSLFAEYTLEGDRIVKKAWGDHFFGLKLGYSPKNGGWSIWDFLNVHVRNAEGRTVDALSASRPSLFAGYSADGADFLAAEWLAPEGKRLKLLFASYPSHRDWLFVRVDLGGAKVERIDFNAYPGNAAVPEGRERHFATRENDWILNKEAASFKPASSSALLYSRYVDERFGNKIVFDERFIESVSVPKTASMISVRFKPAEDAEAAVFALGYFAHKEPSDQVTRFLGEEGDSIAGFLRAVDWDAEPKSDDFKLSVKIALLMGVERKRLEDVAKRYLKAVKVKDMETIAGCCGEVMELRRRKTAEELELLKK
ncbi:MAG: hypothetical protein IKC80_09285 [Kiritimatiellae bacterium]|nr:hypothetical protein [Kiritimatiellia bacterium]